MKNAIIPNADAKVRSTSIKTLGDIHALLIEAGAEPHEVTAISAHICGDSISNACVENGMAVEGESNANTVNRSRNRFATILLDLLRTVAAPVAEKVSAERNAEKDAERQASIADKLKAWEDGHGRGRKPGLGNRPKHEIAIEKANAEARRMARKGLGISEQGRIVPDMQEKYGKEFRDLYTKALKAIGKEYSEVLSLDAEKIEKMVNKAIKNLKIAAVAQKAIKPKVQKDKTTAKKETKEIPVDAEVPSTETADEPVVTE